MHAKRPPDQAALLWTVRRTCYGISSCHWAAFNPLQFSALWPFITDYRPATQTLLENLSRASFLTAFEKFRENTKRQLPGEINHLVFESVILAIQVLLLLMISMLVLMPYDSCVPDFWGATIAPFGTWRPSGITQTLHLMRMEQETAYESVSIAFCNLMGCTPHLSVRRASSCLVF